MNMKKRTRMNSELQNQLYEVAPILYEMAMRSPEWKIDVPDDLFPFLKELSLKIEKFNQRYRKRSVKVMKIAMTGGDFVFLVNRQIPVIEKRIVSARQKIRAYRKEKREALLFRAKHMGTTALFESSLIPDWKRTMPDELVTIRKILEAAEKYAISKGDWTLLARWYRRYLHDDDEVLRCTENASKSE